jgi:hypothetical protein
VVEDDKLEGMFKTEADSVEEVSDLFRNGLLKDTIDEPEGDVR